MLKRSPFAQGVREDGLTPQIKGTTVSNYQAVKVGELTADLRITVFRRATRITVWGTVLAAFAFGLTA